MSTTDTIQEKALLQLLTFSLGEESYGIEVAHVQEVLEMVRITKVPRTQDYMKGIINLRGRVVPVIDLRSKFDLAVQEVITMSPTDVDQSPQIGTSVERRFIRGIGKRDDQFIIILDLAELFDKEELQEMQSVQQD